MLNYAIDPVLLKPFVPLGTELDSYEGTTYVSLVGFLFLKARVLGMIIPFHYNFEEVNLRFYVRRKSTDGWKRGVILFVSLCHDGLSPTWLAQFTEKLANLCQ